MYSFKIDLHIDLAVVPKENTNCNNTTCWYLVMESMRISMMRGD